MSTATALAREICELGRRMWQRGYVFGTDSNLSVRFGRNRVLCTPTLISKGFMQPRDLCVVDLQGNQLTGQRKCTTEILLHLAIMEAQPQAQAVIHCHAPYATAWAALNVAPPDNIFPEKEVWLGPIAVAPYRLTGTPELGKLVAPLARTHYAILLANHGVVMWGASLADAYYRIEMLEGYLQTLQIAEQTGRKLKRLSAAQLEPLFGIKRRLGLIDPRMKS